MNGAIPVGADFERMRRHVHYGVNDIDLTPDVTDIVTPYATLVRTE